MNTRGEGDGCVLAVVIAIALVVWVGWRWLGGPSAEEPAAADTAAQLEARIDDLEGEIEDARQRVESLEMRVEELESRE